MKEVVLLSTIKMDKIIDRIYLPLSLLAIASELERYGYKTKIIDVNVESDWEKVLLKSLHNALFLGISVSIGKSLYYFKKAIQLCKTNANKLPICIGGYFPTFMYELFINNTQIDYVIRGNADDAIVPFTKNLGKKSIKQVPNLVYRRPDKTNQFVKTDFIFTKKVSVPNYDLLDLSKYCINGKLRYIQYCTSYGCLGSCIFCSEPIYCKRNFVSLASEHVINSLINIVECYDPHGIDIVDANFSTDIPRTIKIIKALSELQFGKKILINMKIHDLLKINKEISFKTFRNAGITSVFIGIESDSPRIQKIMGKNINLEKCFHLIKSLINNGIEPHINFINCFPDESIQEIDLTIQYAKKLCGLGMHRQFHHFFVPIPGSKYYMNYKNKIRDITLDDWEKMGTYQDNKFNNKKYKYVVQKLEELKNLYPYIFEYQT